MFEKSTQVRKHPVRPRALTLKAFHFFGFETNGVLQDIPVDRLSRNGKNRIISRESNIAPPVFSSYFGIGRFELRFQLNHSLLQCVILVDFAIAILFSLGQHTVLLVLGSFGGVNPHS